MSTPLPNPSSFDASTTSQAQFRAAQAQLLSYLQGLLGSDGTLATARALLGLALQNYNNRGTWSASVLYNANDYVLNPGNSLAYVCTQTVGPTATTPDADTAHWFLAQGVTVAELESGAPGAGADLSYFTQPVSGAIARSARNRFLDIISILDGFGADPSGVTSSASAVEKATNFANGRPVLFPGVNPLTLLPAVYTIDRPLTGITVWKYCWIGDRNERGANAYGFTGGTYSQTIFNLTDTTTSDFMVERSDPTAPFTSVIGPFQHENITFLSAGTGVAKFGDVVPVVDGAGEKYVFGVSFKGCALNAPVSNHASVAGVITRSGQVLVQLTKAFESVFEDVSLLGSDIQLQFTGCDKPQINRVRSQGSHLPIYQKGSGSFTVLHCIDGLQVEGWTFTPVRSNGVALSCTNSRFEQQDTGITGCGAYNLTTALSITANVTAGSGTLAFSQDMTGILFPDLSVVQISDTNGNVDNALVTAVSGTSVTIDTSQLAITWSFAGATVVRIHGMGPMHSGSFSAEYSNISPGAALNCPAFVYCVGLGSMHISNASAEAGSYGQIQSLVIGNTVPGTGGVPYANSQIAFANCTPLILPDLNNPFVHVDNWKDDKGGGFSQGGGIRGMGGDTFDALCKGRRAWIWDVKRSSTFENNWNLPIKKIAGDANTSQAPYAFYLNSTTSPPYSLGFVDPTLPSVTSGFLRYVVRCKSSIANDTLSLVAGGNGGLTIGTVAITNQWQTVSIVGPMPAPWTGSRGTNPCLILGVTAPMWVEMAAVIDDDASLTLDRANGIASVTHAGNSKTNVAVGTAIPFAVVNIPSTFVNNFAIAKVKIMGEHYLPNTSYSGVLAEFALGLSDFAGTPAVASAVSTLSSASLSQNVGISNLTCTVTAAIVSGAWKFSVTFADSGSAPATAVTFMWEMELTGFTQQTITSL